MAEQSFLAKLGLRLGVLGSTANLALAAPLATGNYDPSCHTAGNRTGLYFDMTASAEKLGIVAGGVTGPTFRVLNGGVQLNLSAGFALARSTFSNAATVLNGASCYVAQVGTMSAARAATLPAANAVPAGTMFTIADESGTVGSTNKITVTAAGGDTINGAATADISTAYGSTMLVSDGTSKWTTIGSGGGGGGAALTATYIGYGDVSNVLTGSPDFVRTGIAQIDMPGDNPTFGMGSGIGNATLTMRNALNSYCFTNIESGGVLRWQTQISEFGFVTRTYDAAGVYQDSPLTIPNAPTSGISLSREVGISGVAATAGSPATLSVYAAAHTTLAASLEATDIFFSLARNVQFSTGAIATQRAVVITAPTYQFVGASVITTAATLAVSGPPVAGTNATITVPLAFWVQSGMTHLDGATVINVNGAALPATPAANEMVLQIGGVDGTTTRMIIDGFGGSPSYCGRAAVGTNGSKTAVVNNTVLVQLVAMGYDGSAYTTGAKGNVVFLGSETWSGSQTGTKYQINLTPSGSLTNTAIYTLSPLAATQLCTDAATSTSTVVNSWNHATSGTPAAGFGSQLQIQGYDDGANTLRTMCQINVQWTDPATATRSSKLSFVTVSNAATFNSLILAPTIATFQATDAVTAGTTIVANFTHSTSGTAANGFGNTIQISGPDDGGTSRVLAQLSTTWTTAATATRTSKLFFNVVSSTVTSTALTLLGSGGIVCQSGFPVTISDTTASTTTAGALLIGTGTAATTVTFGGGNGNIGGSITVAGIVQGNPLISISRIIMNGTTTTTADTTGRCSMWRSGGTYLGTTAGDWVFQTDLVGVRDYVFTAGATTPAIVAKIGGNGTFTVTGTTVTVSTPVLDLTQTWNDGAVAFTGIRLNVTNSGSLSASFLMDLQVGGASVFNINRVGGITTAGNFAMTAGTISVGGITQAVANTATSGASAGFSTFTVTVNPASSSTATQVGINSSAATNSANAQNLTDATAGLRAIFARTVHAGTGTVTGMTCIITQPFTTNSSGTVTNAYGAYMLDGSKSGGTTITNLYGLFIASQTAGTNNWAIKTGSGAVTFGDRQYFNCASSAPTDGNIPTAAVSWYLDEAGNNIKVRVRYSDGTTLKTGTLALV